MFKINRRGAVIGLVIAGITVLAGLLVGSAGATGSAPVQRRDIVVRQVATDAPSVNLTSDDPGAVHGAVGAPVDTAAAVVSTSSAADRAPVELLAADDPTVPPTSPAPVEPPANEPPPAPPAWTNTPEPTTEPPLSPENTPVQTPTLAPRD